MMYAHVQNPVFTVRAYKADGTFDRFTSSKYDDALKKAKNLSLDTYVRFKLMGPDGGSLMAGMIRNGW